MRRIGWFVLALVALLASPATASAQTVHPPEYAASDEILWGCRDTYLVSSIYKAAVQNTTNENARHSFFIDSRETAYQLMYDMYYANVPLAKTKFMVCALDSVWMRDYGPFVMSINGKKTVFDVNYYYNRPEDDAFPRLWARYKGYGYQYGDMDYEGGNFMTNGRGVGFASASVYGFNKNRGNAAVNSVYAAMGCSRVETFEWLRNDGTTHIDMYAKLLNDNTVLVSRAVNGSQNYALLERNAAKFQSLGFRVLRATMADDNLSTYTNSLIVGSTVLVPTYANQARDAEAIAAYQSAGLRTVAIDCRKIIPYGGAIHCISMQCAR